MDDPDKMDLALNSDFDPSLLNWETTSNGKAGVMEESKNTCTRSQASSTDSPTHSDNGGQWGDGSSSPNFSQLPSFAAMMDDDQNNSSRDNSSTSTSSQQQEQQCEEERLHRHPGSPSSSLAAAVAAGRAQQPQTNDDNNRRKPSPVPVSTTVSVASSSTKATTHVANGSRSSNDHHHHHHHQQQHQLQHNRASLPTMSTKDALLELQSNAAAAASKHDQAANANAFLNPHHHHNNHTHHHHHQDGHGHSHNGTRSQQQHQQQQNHLHPSSTDGGATTTQLHPLAIPSSANCPPHVVTGGGMSTNMSLPNALFPLNLSALNGGQTTHHHPGAFAASTTNTNMPQTGQGLPHMFFQSQAVGLPDAAMAGIPQQQQQQQLQPQKQSSNNSNPATATTPPPFYLFDAPIELRANFMQSQRMHGLPVHEDCNSYHYGVAVNGFHPQQALHNNNSHLMDSHALSSAASSSTYNASSIQLIDARHGSRKAGRIKNEREQRRAQKITELIEQLREKMEKGGWKVEMKSKFHTLSSCADYVRHLIKTTKEKEEAVNKAKSDLQMKERKVEEEKANQARSDPESVMSSLTSSTGLESDRSSAKKVSCTDQSSDEDPGEQRKRKSQSGAKDNSKGNKKSRLSSSSDSFGSSESSGEERGSSSSDGQNISSVSDITDSNKGSSNSGSSNQRSDDDDESGTPSSISASSDAAVVLGVDRSQQHVTKHADVVIKGRNSDRRKLPKEVTSLEESFVLDYEEVFLKSNVPQIIATTAGRIVAWNELFLKATGVSRAGVKGLTIFSLVKPDKLSNLFEIVAKALRKETQQSPPTSSESDTTSDGFSQWNYAAMTLPCVDFPPPNTKGEDGMTNPLYITVTLMGDEDPRKRLFHCVFTDCPGTNGALGSITPELLSLLFTRHRKLGSSEKKSH